MGLQNCVSSNLAIPFDGGLTHGITGVDVFGSRLTACCDFDGVAETGQNSLADFDELDRERCGSLALILGIFAPFVEFRSQLTKPLKFRHSVLTARRQMLPGTEKKERVEEPIFLQGVPECIRAGNFILVAINDIG